MLNYTRIKRAQSPREMAEMFAEPYIQKKHLGKFASNLLIKGIQKWLEAESTIDTDEVQNEYTD